MRVAVKIELTDIERSTLVKWSRGRSTPARLVQRAQIVLAAAAGRESQEIAAELGCAPKTVSQWRNRFAIDRLAGIKQDAPRGGRRPTQRERFEAEIIRKTTQETPRTRRSGRHVRWPRHWAVTTCWCSECGRTTAWPRIA